MVHRDCEMGTKMYENGDFSDFIRQHKYKINVNNRVEEEDGDGESPERAKPRNYIEHRVSKMDTLAGVAIKYGVEVADVKRMNGLVTDLQMFARKTLHIPLPGRHPPSSSLDNGLDSQGQSSSKQTPHRRRHSDLFDSFQALKPKYSAERTSSAMTSLQDYYGIKQGDQKTASEGLEMAIYRKEGSNCLQDGEFAQFSPLSDFSLSLLRKSKSVANSLFSMNGQLSNSLASKVFGEGGSEKWNEKFIRRRQKSELNSNSPPPGLLMEDSNSNSIGVSTRTGKGLALRPKSASRTSSGVDPELEKVNPVPIGMQDSILLESFNSVRKSSSTSNLQDDENWASSASSIWETAKWSLKPDLQALSAAVTTMPIFDGLPKPITGRKNKAALD